ncbi:unnamed protein product, partial [Gadus morhua 'NCC']
IRCPDGAPRHHTVACSMDTNRAGSCIMQLFGKDPWKLHSDGNVKQSKICSP